MINRRFLVVLGVFLFGVLGCQLPDPDDYARQTNPPKKPPLEPPPLVLGFVLLDVVPDTGPIRGGELVALSGGGFQEGARVFFGGSDGINVLVTSPERIWVTTPPHSAGSVTVRVVNPDGGEVAMSQGYAYHADRHISAVVPSVGPSTGGIPIEIHGTGLRGVDTVLVGGRVALDSVVVDDSTVLAVLPEGVAGDVDVHLVGSGTLGRFDKGFRYMDALRVLGLAPQVGSTAGGGVLSLTGDGLVPDSLVFLGDHLADTVMTSADGHQLAVRIPEGAPGGVDLTIVTPLETLVLPNAYTYMTEGEQIGGRVYGVWPPSGPASGGTEVVITVTDLPEDSEDVAVHFGQESATVTHVFATQNRLHVLTPPGAPGDAPTISVATPEHSDMTLAGGFVYDPTFTITQVSPKTGTTDGGTAITIAGEGFGADAEVWVGSLPATHVVVHGPNHLTAKTAEGSPGPATVRVRSSNRTVSMVDAFEYDGLPSELYVLSPQSAAIAGNTLVHLHGVNLPASGTLWFGDYPVEVSERLSSIHVLAKTPRVEDIGTVSVHLADAQRQLDLPHPFTFYDPRSQWGGDLGTAAKRFIECDGKRVDFR